MAEYWQALVACFVMGFGVGGETPIVFALASEYLPARLRGRILLFLGIAASMGGYALAAAVATASNATLPTAAAWRAMWLFGLAPAALILLFRRQVIPESARYLLSHGRVDEARAAAESLVGPLASRDAPWRDSRDTVAGWTQAPPAGPLGARVATLSFFSFAWGLANFGFLTWLPTLLQRLGLSSTSSSGYLALSASWACPPWSLPRCSSSSGEPAGPSSPTPSAPPCSCSSPVSAWTARASPLPFSSRPWRWGCCSSRPSGGSSVCRDGTPGALARVSRAGFRRARPAGSW
jgi:MFS family permease